jgi:hypothetical protein
VLRETDPQAGLTLWEVLLPEEVKRLPAELARSTPTWTTTALHPPGFGGGGLEWPQEGVIDQVRSLPVGEIATAGLSDRSLARAALTGVDQERPWLVEVCTRACSWLSPLRASVQVSTSHHGAGWRAHQHLLGKRPRPGCRNGATGGVILGSRRCRGTTWCSATTRCVARRLLLAGL